MKNYFGIQIVPQLSGFVVYPLFQKQGGGFLPTSIGTAYNGSDADNVQFKDDFSSYVDKPDGHRWLPIAPIQQTPQQKQAQENAIDAAAKDRIAQREAKSVAQTPPES